MVFVAINPSTDRRPLELFPFSVTVLLTVSRREKSNYLDLGIRVSADTDGFFWMQMYGFGPEFFACNSFTVEPNLFLPNQASSLT